MSFINFLLEKGILEESPEEKEVRLKKEGVQKAASVAPTIVPVTSAPVKVPTPVAPVVKYPGAVSEEEKLQAHGIVASKVFVGDDAYMNYRMMRETLDETMSDLPILVRRKTAWKTVKKGSGDKLPAAVAQHRQLFEKVRAEIEASLNPEHGGKVDQLRTEVSKQDGFISAKDQKIAELNAAIDQLRREKESAQQAKSDLERKVEEELAKQAHAKEVFEVALDLVSSELAEDEQLVSL